MENKHYNKMEKIISLMNNTNNSRQEEMVNKFPVQNRSYNLNYDQSVYSILSQEMMGYTPCSYSFAEMFSELDQETINILSLKKTKQSNQEYKLQDHEILVDKGYENWSEELLEFATCVAVINTTNVQVMGRMFPFASALIEACKQTSIRLVNRCEEEMMLWTINSATFAKLKEEESKIALCHSLGKISSISKYKHKLAEHYEIIDDIQKGMDKFVYSQIFKMIVGIEEAKQMMNQNNYLHSMIIDTSMISNIINMGKWLNLIPVQVYELKNGKLGVDFNKKVLLIKNNKKTKELVEITVINEKYISYGDTNALPVNVLDYEFSVDSIK